LSRAKYPLGAIIRCRPLDFQLALSVPDRAQRPPNGLYAQLLDRAQRPKGLCATERYSHRNSKWYTATQQNPA